MTIYPPDSDPITYTGTPGLWELIVSRHPDENIYTDGDWLKYKDLVSATNTLYKNNDPSNTQPKSSRSEKWSKHVRRIWKSPSNSQPPPRKVGSSVSFLPSDPNALSERLDLLLSSKAAGNTGLRNELVAICDELKRQGELTEQDYSEFNKIINK